MRGRTYLTRSLHGLGISVAGSGVHFAFRLGKLALEMFSLLTVESIDDEQPTSPRVQTQINKYF